MKYGPTYLLLGSRLTDDTYLLRVLLEGFNTWGRQWDETLIIGDNGSLRELQNEVEQFRYLEHRKVTSLDKPRPNIVIAFMDRIHHSRETERWIRDARRQGIPAFLISTID